MMFLRLRWRLAAFFTCSITVVCFAMTGFSSFAFYEQLTVMLDNQMKQLSAQLYPFLEVNAPGPGLQRWRKHKTPWPFSYTAEIQVYNSAAKLVEKHGPDFNVPFLSAKQTTIQELQINRQTMRVLSQPLIRQGKDLGWLQIALPTTLRDDAMVAYARTGYISLLLLLVALSSIGYMYAGRSLVPLQKSFDLTRNFLADAGHELKTPLTVLQANVEALEMDLAENDEARPRVLGILESCQRISCLSQDLLLLAKLESPSVGLPRQNVALGDLVLETVHDLAPLYGAKGVEITHELVEAKVWCHYDSIRRATTNLLDNALAFTDPGGSVRISLRVHGAYVEVSVTDNGIGIAEHDIPKIFDRFYRVDKSRSRRNGGTGLGLAIAKAIVESHKGTLFVKSKLGSGSTFLLALPISTVA
ncbi:MAG: hypothetical protein EKK48_21915 [Candidatus Melainabacteria bacterium]|nr:MAG: hypothetical protein EKK48_21915 [Candidatus Melainabacteria bacterium]